MVAVKEPKNVDTLVGSIRRAGTYGPPYVVLSVTAGTAEILFPESDQKATLPVQAVKEDPLDK